MIQGFQALLASAEQVRAQYADLSARLAALDAAYRDADLAETQRIRAEVATLKPMVETAIAAAVQIDSAVQAAREQAEAEAQRLIDAADEAYDQAYQLFNAARDDDDQLSDGVGSLIEEIDEWIVEQQQFEAGQSSRRLAFRVG